MKTIAIIILACGVVPMGFAQSSNTLLTRYRQMALAYNHDLKAAEKSISASMALIESAKDDLKPKVEGTANFQYTANPMQLTLSMPMLETPLSFSGQDTRYGATLSLLQPLYTGGRLLESIKLAQKQHSYSTHQFDKIRSAVCFQTDLQYWNSVASVELTALYALSFQAMGTLKQIVEERVEAGITDPQDLLMVEVRMNDNHYQLLRAKNSEETHRMALNSLIGEALKSTLLIDTILSNQVDDSSVEGSSLERPEVRMAYDQVEIKQSALKLHDAHYKPQLFVGAEGSYASPGYNFKRDMDPNYALYAKLSVPLFEWGKRRSDKRANRLQVMMAQDQLNRVRDAVTLEVESAQSNLTQATQRVALTENSLSKAHENELKAIERYHEGSVSIVEVIDAQLYKQTAQINFVQAKLALQSSYAELLRATDGYNVK